MSHAFTNGERLLLAEIAGNAMPQHAAVRSIGCEVSRIPLARLASNLRDSQVVSLRRALTVVLRDRGLSFPLIAPMLGTYANSSVVGFDRDYYGDKMARMFRQKIEERIKGDDVSRRSLWDEEAKG